MLSRIAAVHPIRRESLLLARTIPCNASATGKSRNAQTCRRYSRIFPFWHLLCAYFFHSTNFSGNTPANNKLFLLGKVVPGEIQTSNTILDTLEEWNQYLKQENIDLDELSSKPKKQARPRVQRPRLSI
ncbi:hypothetical protein [Pararhizobium sp. IMCC21322]|uniref:hypothetical protein n=1 Tax=Pararhizobium sp. IMCC21322 TaxID=3067903 RepID=UPI0027413E66|nr:hypothetical protein [Pararhizobium sp. IMCC21322]